MTNSKSDKPLVLKLIAGSVLAILIFTFAWSKQFFANLDIWYFTLIEGGLLATFIVESIGAYHYSEDPDKDWKRHFVWILALACCAWAAGWSCGSNGKKMMDDDIKKAKQTSSAIQDYGKLKIYILSEEEAAKQDFDNDIIWLGDCAATFPYKGQAL